MRRREFIGTLGATAIVGPATVLGQQADRLPRVGVLMMLPESDPEAKRRIGAFEQGLQELGLRDGRNIHIDYRWGTADLDQVARNAKELVGLKPNVLVAVATPAVAALLRETRTIPIVFVALADPVGQGIVQSLAHPGGNATGSALFEFSMGGKWLELFNAIAPSVTRVALMFNPDTAAFGPLYLRAVEAAAPSFSVEVVAVPVHDDPEVERAMITLARQWGSGLIVLPDSFTAAHRASIIELAARYRVPALYTLPYFAKDGGLLSYGADMLDLHRRAASYVDRILKGTKPIDLPVQQPTKFELIINLKTANELDLIVPPSLLARADEVIE
jgi:ABC-type uncharacterized transport system substrate-binding protein